MDGDAEAVDVEGDAARRAVGLAARGPARARSLPRRRRRSARGATSPQITASSSIRHTSTRRVPWRRRSSRMRRATPAAGETSPCTRPRCRCWRRRRCRSRCDRCRIARRGCGDGRSQVGGGDLRCWVVVPLPNSAVPVTAHSAVFTQRDARSERCSVGGAVSCMASAMPCPVSQSPPSGRQTPLPRASAPHDLDALIEAELRDLGVVGLLAGETMASPGLTTLRWRRLERVHPERPGQLVHGAFDGVDRLRQTVAADGAGRARCWCRRCRRRSSCSGSGRARLTHCRRGRASRRRGCRRRRCWRRCAAGCRSACRRAWRRA